MASAPWLRLMKRIRPSVIDIPTEMTNNTMPYDTPSMRMLRRV